MSEDDGNRIVIYNDDDFKLSIIGIDQEFKILLVPSDNENCSVCTDSPGFIYMGQVSIAFSRETLTKLSKAWLEYVGKEKNKENN